MLHFAWFRLKNQLAENEKSFGWDWKIIRLRTFYRFPQWKETERWLKHPSFHNALYVNRLPYTLIDEGCFFKTLGSGGENSQFSPFWKIMPPYSGVSSVVFFNISQQSIVLLVRKRITSNTFGIEQIDMAVFHADDEVHIEQKFAILGSCSIFSNNHLMIEFSLFFFKILQKMKFYRWKLVCDPLLELVILHVGFPLGKLCWYPTCMS